MGPDLTSPPSREELRLLLGVYAIGALDDVEREQVERFVLEDHDARSDLHQLQLGVAWLDHASGRAPLHVWPRIAAELHDAVPATAAADLDAARRRAARRSLPRLLAVAAAVAAAVVGVGGARAVLDGGSAPGGGVAAAARAAERNPDARRVALRTPEGQARASVVVLPNGRAYLVDARFDRAGAGMTYQLWTISASGPKSAGVLSRAPSVHRFTIGDEVSVVAVTVERAPGSSAPTSTPIATASLA